MQNVSQKWKDNQEQYLVGESYVEVILNVGDPESQEDASDSDNGSDEISNTPQIVDGTDKNVLPYASLELNSWLLSSNRIILPDAPPYGDTGYIGDVLSGDDGSFSSIPTITISFSKLFTSVIPGITIDWGTAYGEYADSFIVTAYSGEAVSASTTVTGNRNVSSVVNLDIEEYDKIVIQITRWCLPHHRARISNILVGIKQTYSKTELMNYSHTIEVDPVSAALPTIEIEFSISNLNGQYNPDNPQGAEKYLMERQEITARYGYLIDGAIEWIPAGTFYMSEWDTPQNGITASFKARDMQELMTDTYSGPVEGTLLEIATAAFEQAALPKQKDGSNRWIVDVSLETIHAPEGASLDGNTIAEVLQYVANAACCVFYQDRGGIYHIEPLPSGVTDYEINQFRSYENSEISLSKQLKAVSINDGAAVVSFGSAGETQDVNNPLVSAERAETVATWIGNYLKNRRILSGEFRADPRLDALDRVSNENQFAQSTVLVTSIKYTYNGAFRGTYEGRAEA